MPKLEATLATAVSVVVQEKKSVDVAGTSINQITIDLINRQVWAYVSLKMVDGSEMEKRTIFLEGSDFDQCPCTQDMLGRVQNCVQSLCESGQIGGISKSLPSE